MIYDDQLHRFTITGTATAKGDPHSLCPFWVTPTLTAQPRQQPMHTVWQAPPGVDTCATTEPINIDARFDSLGGAGGTAVGGYGEADVTIPAHPPVSVWTAVTEMIRLPIII